MLHMKTLQQIMKDYNLSDCTFSTDKERCHKYISTFYEDYFKEFADKKDIVLLEIGIWDGGSLLLWSKYFSNGTIYGIDISDRVPKEVRSIDNIKLIFTDAYTEAALELFPYCDIIIDDGSHHVQHQEFVIREYTKKLKAGGVLIIEDVSRAEPLKMVAQSIGFTNTAIINKRTSDDILLVIRKEKEI